MRILHAYRDMLSRGGRPDDSRDLISALSEAGHDTAVVSYPPTNGTPPIFPDERVRVFVIPKGRASLPGFAEAVEAFRPDVVHFTGGPRLPAQVFWARAARKKGIPFFASACGNLSPETFRYRWGGRKNRFYNPYLKRVNHEVMDRRFLREAAAVHAGSRNEAEISLDAGARAVFVAPYGVRSEWVDKPVSERAVRDPMVFTYLGRLSIIHKGLDLIVEAFGRVVEAGYGDRIRLILAGTDEKGSMSALRRRTEELGIRDVSFPGGVWADDKLRLWEETDYFLHVCRYNGFALSVREALGRGLPIITTRESDIGDWTQSNNMGVVTQLSPGAIAEAVIGALNRDASTYSAMSRNARAFAERVSWRYTAALCLKAYEGYS